MPEDILLEIRKLREEMSALTAKMSSLRYADFKTMCAEYMRPIIADEGRKAFEDDCDTKQQTICSLKNECTSNLKNLVDKSLKLFEGGDIQGAIELLSAAINKLQCGMHDCPDSECPNKKLELMQRIKSIQSTYQRILNNMDIDSPIIDASAAFTEEEVEDYLMPLSNSRRISILKNLTSGSKTLSSLCKEFNMPTGHISFHLNALREMGYVSKDPKTKLYSISAKGAVALNEIGILIQKLKSTVC